MGDKPTTPRAVQEALRSALLNGDMAPGQRLIEAELAEKLQVTRASVRSALLGLEADGLVERVPNRGARVRVVTIEEAVAVTECRMMLEGLCAAKAAERCTRTQIGVLSDLGAKMRQAVKDGEPLTYSGLNRELHSYVQSIAAQPVATDLLRRLNGQIVRHQFHLALRSGRPQVSLPQHLAIIDAISRHDPAAAEQAMRDHLSDVIEAYRQSAS